MKIYLIDDDSNILHLLQQIVADKEVGQVIGTATLATQALADLSHLQPDIIMVDLLMPEMDGIAFVEQAQHLCQATFVMLSQVTSKNLIARAYEAGIDYFINKPINAIEVTSVIKKVTAHIENQNKILAIQSMLGQQIPSHQLPPASSLDNQIDAIMKNIGILGENGSKDISMVIHYLINSEIDTSTATLKTILEHFDENPKSMEQRIRRTAFVGLNNLANLGLEDYMNENFVEYANSLYQFNQVRQQMNYIRGISQEVGKVNLRKFLEGFLYYIH